MKYCLSAVSPTMPICCVMCPAYGRQRLRHGWQFISIRGSNLDSVAAVDYDGSGVKPLQDGLPVIDSYTLWGLRAGLSRKNWEVYGEIPNLADKNYVAHQSVCAITPANAAILSPGSRVPPISVRKSDSEAKHEWKRHG
jgi:hypothetical protein